MGLAIIAAEVSGEEVRHPSEYAKNGENYQAHDEQVFHHALTVVIF